MAANKLSTLRPLGAVVYNVFFVNRVFFFFVHIFEILSRSADPALGPVWNLIFIPPICPYCTGEGNLLTIFIYWDARTKSTHSYMGHTHTGVGVGFYSLPSTTYCNMHTLMLLNFLFQNHPT